ncbi:WbqC family protein [Noviherbaspirillum denitrificans]|uniref:WbqC family protein n=1 Tax=Noviherbaspirillum denitrificans TaxID=1968433 RepID=UPI0019824705|nr:WbqC family protein [Noviherbaspirillum denitrificans]
MKRVGMMQPYLFPYLGYFQLISSVDVFVLGDDLQYVKESWINRNRILMNGKDKLITFPLKKGSLRANINEREFCDDFDVEMDKLLRVIASAYSKAPYFKKVFPMLQAIIKHPERNLARYAEHSIRQICNYLDIHTPIIVASELNVTDVIDKQDRVIRTAKKVGGDVYINFIGGMSLYDFEYFKQNGLTLKFHKINEITYPQFGNVFVPLLSIIDVMMFNDQPEVKRRLGCYSLLDAPDHAVSVCDHCTACLEAKAEEGRIARQEGSADDGSIAVDGQQQAASSVCNG